MYKKNLIWQHELASDCDTFIKIKLQIMHMQGKIKLLKAMVVEAEIIILKEYI